MKEGKNLFLVFGLIQAISLGFIVYFVLGSLGAIGFDSQLVLSCVFPVFTLVLEYMIYLKK
jgi:hypothetical protein